MMMPKPNGVVPEDGGEVIITGTAGDTNIFVIPEHNQNPLIRPTSTTQKYYLSFQGVVHKTPIWFSNFSSIL